MPTTFPRGHGSASLRKGRYSSAGQIYLVTFTTHDRQRRFEDFAQACAAARALHDAGSAKGSRLLAWVLMPDHCHVLVELGDAEPLSRWVARLKAAMFRAVRAIQPGSAVWCRGFHDRAVRDGDELRDMARYLVLNPVRAGLVARLGMYPFWDAVWL